MARLIGIVTTARSDFGCLRPLMRAVRDHPALALRVFVSGTHFFAVNGYSRTEVEAEFGECAVPVPCTIESDRPPKVGCAMAEVLGGFARALAEVRPDVMVVLGDRWDMIPAVLAAAPFNIPVAHLSGGEVTEGVIDDSIRHAVTKLAHLHFPACEEYGRRLRQLGEETWRIRVTGEPGLDGIADQDFPSKAEVYRPLGLDPERPLSLFTYHPETIGHEHTASHIATILAAAAEVAADSQILFTHPNSDTGSAAIVFAIHAFVENCRNCQVLPSLGRERFFNVLHHCQALVGNSSSGIVESASFRLPAVNIGDRQKGRIAPPNVISVPINRESILVAWRQALSPAFHANVASVVNPYGDGHAAPRIAAVLAEIPIDRALLVKRFVDWTP